MALAADIDVALKCRCAAQPQAEPLFFGHACRAALACKGQSFRRYWPKSLQTTPRCRTIMLLKIFLTALAIRWAYALALFAIMGSAGFQGTDSIGFLTNAHAFAAAMSQGNLHGFEWLGTNPIVMPLFAWLLGLNALVFGAYAPLTYALMQGAIDAGTCLLIYALAGTLHPRLALPSAMLSAVNPTQIVLSALIYNDALFLFFVTAFLLAAARWLKSPSWHYSLFLGLGLGLASIVRILAVPWIGILLLFLFLVSAAMRSLTVRKVMQIIVAGIIAAACVAPVVWRNHSAYGTFALTPQSGQHLALWVVPLVKEARDGTPWQTTYEQMKQRERDRFPSPAKNLFDDSNRYRQIATEELAELGTAAMVKAWTTGAIINIAAPAVILSPLVSQLPRTGFYQTPGASPFQKVYNFLFRSDNATYSWILIFGIIGVAALRMTQAAGLFAMLQTRRHWPELSLFTLWIVYILAINGPVASPKYRLPLEPPLMVLAGAGLIGLRHRMRPGATPL